MGLKKTAKKSSRKPRDPGKESIYRVLRGLMEEAGVEVRREKLKQGHGWKVASGSCRLEEQQVVFVDSKMAQDEQISFLVNEMVSRKIEVPNPAELDLPETIKEALSVH